METIFKDSTKIADKLMSRAFELQDEFLTGKPLSVNRYGLDENNKITWVSFNTENGIEDLYKNSKCLSDAQNKTVKLVVIKFQLKL